ncbi:MBL fold hydrolase [Vulcanimicrobium alpinum]|uniref:MBL fold hydrolase n=1 Tax=Vulcanimicrobium alpinum TaxID=3016050 RepID=A0AAN1XT65_UNVUL|nr:MBL fold metallo-hydrolase [Vulcanimicrobium alpinum]BDE05251.1 MBL fold hydrolase [Vulcanimicrobium alpinum]
MVSLRFLGTGGARWVVAKQIRSSAGFWLRTGTTNVHVDPGPGALVRALALVPPCDPATLDAIVLSHKHLDHAGDVNAMIEAMCQGGWRPRGALCAPRDALDRDEEPVVFPYARRFVPAEFVVAEHSGPFAIGDVELRASMRLKHPVEAYGLHFRTPEARVSYLPCTRYFDAIADDFRAHAPDVLVLNVLRYRDTMDVDHLTFDDARTLIDAIRPGAAIMSHFGTRMLERDPKRLAYEIEDATGVKTFAAYDGWTYDAA